MLCLFVVVAFSLLLAAWSLNLTLLLARSFSCNHAMYNVAVKNFSCIQHNFFSSISFFAIFHTTIRNQSFSIILFTSKPWCLCCSPLHSSSLLLLSFSLSNILLIALFSFLVHWSLRLFLLLLMLSYCCSPLLFRFRNKLQFWRQSHLYTSIQEERSLLTNTLKNSTHISCCIPLT